MNRRHSLVHYGTKRMNWGNRYKLTDTFVRLDGTTVNVRKSKAPGIHFGGMDGDGEMDIIFRVGDVTLDNPIVLDWDRWQPHDRGVAPNGKRISDMLASKILEEAIAQNPGQHEELSDFRGQIRS